MATKLLAEQMVRLSRLLDEALELDEAGRTGWLESLSPGDQDLKEVLCQMLLKPRALGLEALSALAAQHLIGEPSRLRIGDRVGPYVLTRQLGQGGMAQVWLAQRVDGILKREVALKIPAFSLARPDLSDRFARERDILASLEHPNITRLYDAGVTEQGLPYLAMEYVAGEPVTAWSDARRSAVPDRLRILLQVLDAVQYAHRRQVVHRDIKPSNILVSEEGQVHLLDFGVAKLLQREPTEITQAYGQALTPAYASPEQLQGEQVGISGDLYALGIVLYELLSGNRPYELTGHPLGRPMAPITVAPPSTKLTAQSCMERSSTQARLVRQLRGDLDAIALKAIARDPDQRYSSAEALADDIRRHLNGEAVQARFPTPAYHLSKFVRRNFAVVASIATIVMLATLAGYLLIRPPQTPAAAPDSLEAAVDDKSIAVLPFVDMSENRDQEHISDGLSEELIDLLAKVPDLRVPARASSFYFRGKSDDVASIAGRLHVAHVLEGSVRKAGGRLRVTAQLIRADNGYLLWSETYDRELRDVFQVQDDVAEAVLAALKAQLLPNQLSLNSSRTANTDAYDHYLRGKLYRASLFRDSLLRAAEEFRAAVALDPKYAIAYAKLAESEARLADQVGDSAEMQTALTDAGKAVLLGPGLAEAYSTRGEIRGAYFWDWPGAQADLEKARKLGPNEASTQRLHAALLSSRGRLSEALEVARKTVDLDPLSSIPWYQLGLHQQQSGDLAGSRQSLNRALELAPDFEYALFVLGTTEVLSGRGQVALDTFKRLTFPPVRLYGIALAEEALGHSGSSQRALDQLIARGAHAQAFQIAQVYAFRGEKDKAFRWLERAYAQRDGGLTYLAVAPLLRNLRGDSRFKMLLLKMGLADS